MKIEDFYNKDADFKRFVDLNADMYGKSAEFMMHTPTAQAYRDWLLESRKGRINENTYKDIQ